MRVYILDQRKDNKQHNAVGKAMTDTFAIMKKCKVKKVPGVPKNWTKAVKALDLLILAFYCLVVFSKNTYVIFVYQENALKIKLLEKLKSYSKYKVICFVNDVNSIRSDGLYSEKRKADIDRDFALIGSADIIMAPNEGAKKYMLERGIKSNIVTVGVWDYLLDEEEGTKCDENVAAKAVELGKSMSGRNSKAKPWSVGFAGNLGKSGFVDYLDKVSSPNLHYRLWGDADGKSFEDTFNNSVIYEGSVHPDDLPWELSKKCDFGLVWDGESATEIEGGYGEYLRFNNSHKCGCYLAAGIPVFVWKESGMAYFVNETGCGFVIEGLQDITRIVGRMTQEDYFKLLERVKVVSKNVRNGYYLETALGKAISKKEQQ